jgi:hypothetical protein
MRSCGTRAVCRTVALLGVDEQRRKVPSLLDGETVGDRPGRGASEKPRV